MHLCRQARAARAGELIGMDSRDELRIESGFENVARLVDAEVPLITEHVAEPGARPVRLLAPAGHFLGVLAQVGAAVRRKSVRGEERDLDTWQVVALPEAIEDASRFQLSVVLEVVSGLCLDRRRPALKPARESQGSGLLEGCRRRGTGCRHGGADRTPRLGQ